MTKFNWRKITMLILALIPAISIYGQPQFYANQQVPQSYIAYKAPEPVIIDGQEKDIIWEDTPWSTYFVDIEGDKRPKPKFNTRFKMLWDDQYLYVYAELQEPDIWAKLTQHDQVVYYDNDFEIFIDPDGDSYNYFEIEVNALETVFDLFIGTPYRSGGLALIPWNADGLKLAVGIDGSINDPSDTDNKWSVEMAIPFKSISMGNNIQIPDEGSIWRINFSRVQWQVEVTDNEYRKTIDPDTDRPFNEDNWVWSPQGIINMHYPEKWGYVRFSKEQPKKDISGFTLPEGEKIKEQLWRIYYQQQAYFHKHEKYASDIESLKIDIPYEHNSHVCQINMESTKEQFTATMVCQALKESWRINEMGRITKINDFKNQ